MSEANDRSTDQSSAKRIDARRSRVSEANDRSTDQSSAKRIDARRSRVSEANDRSTDQSSAKRIDARRSRVMRACCPACMCVALLTACEKRASTPPNQPTAASSAAQGSGLTWDDASAGPVLFVAGSNETEAAIIYPHFTDSTLGTVSTLDTGGISRGKADLFARGGLIGTAVIVPKTAGVLGGECTAWPTARVRSLDRATGGVPGPWTVGFVTGRAIAVTMDSIPMLSPADSATRTADVARVASSLPNDTAPAFRGLPFEVQRAGRFSIAPGIDGIAAVLARHVNEEANPREEHIFLIAERDSTQLTWVAAYSERESGAEDDLETNEVLATVRLGPGRTPTIVLSRDYGDGGVYSLIERAAPGQWRLRWSSAYTGC